VAGTGSRAANGKRLRKLQAYFRLYKDPWHGRLALAGAVLSLISMIALVLAWRAGAVVSVTLAVVGLLGGFGLCGWMTRRWLANAPRLSDQTFDQLVGEDIARHAADTLQQSHLPAGEHIDAGSPIVLVGPVAFGVASPADIHICEGQDGVTRASPIHLSIILCTETSAVVREAVYDLRTAHIVQDVISVLELRHLSAVQTRRGPALIHEPQAETLLARLAGASRRGRRALRQALQAVINGAEIRLRSRRSVSLITDGAHVINLPVADDEFLPGGGGAGYEVHNQTMVERLRKEVSDRLYAARGASAAPAASA
jgi:hypothetical protein